jgi:Amt family ammonium transporter
MRKLIASFALGLAALGLLGVAHAEETAASAPPCSIASATEASAAAPAEAASEAASATEAAPAAAPVPNKGDTAWMMVSTLW